VAALSDDSGLIFGLRRRYEKGRSDELAILISDVLKKAHCPLKKIDYFGIGVGPGSFTGLRIGLSTIKGLSFGLRKPCLPFSSLDAIAFNKAPYQSSRLAVLVDARRSNIYARFYHLDSSARDRKVTRVSSDTLLSLTSLKKKMKKNTDISGDALKTYKEDFERGGISTSVPEKFWYPTPESLVLLAQESFKAGKRVSCFELSAAYLYKQDCQIRKRP
jgi:tRNA threonylcarbamoyladenosine biosynthesis protein TsaB